MPRKGRRSPFDPDTHYSIVPSDTPVNVDGYKLGEPQHLRCDECGASVLLTPEPSPGIDELQHEPDCPQRWARSDWWAMQFANGVEPAQPSADKPVIADGSGRED